MLKQRIITALILIPLFLLAVIKLSPLGFFILTAMIVLLSGWEWSGLMGIANFFKKLIFPFILIFFLVFSVFVPIKFILWISFIWWLIATFLIFFYPKLSKYWGHSIIIRALMGFLVLIPCWRAINFIRDGEHGLVILLFLCVLIWGADSGAYFVGKKWGKTKLAPHVSPGKTWQGLIGALLTTVFIVGFAIYIFSIPQHRWLSGLLLSLTTVIFSVIGDLFESMLKRQVGIKDSSRLLPGHGGILDRIDSLTAAAPIFALGAIMNSG